MIRIEDAGWIKRKLFNYFMDVHRLNLVTHEWQCLYRATGDNQNEPNARYRHEIVIHNNLIHILGMYHCKDYNANL